MSKPRPRRLAAFKDRAAVFAALGDATRLSLVSKLSHGPAQSISRLAEGSPLSRQAITKHLSVLEDAGVVHRARVGRESMFHLQPEPLKDIQSYLDDISAQWDEALERLRSFVEH